MNKYNTHTQFLDIWISKIPARWQAHKMKHLFSERSEKGYPNEPLLVASQNMGVVPKNVYGNRTVEAQKDLHLLKLVRVGDFVISLRSFQGGLEYAYYQGIISPAYTILIPHEPMSGPYFRYLAKSKPFIGLLTLCVTGIREGQNIDYAKLKNHLLPVPPRDEQDQIVRFLDWKVSSINKLIAVKQKQIATLKEFMQTEIEKQLYAYPVVSVVRLKQLGTFFKGGGFSRDNLVEDEEYPAILYGDIYTQYEYKTSIITHHIDGTAYSASRKILKGDIVMAGTGETKDEIGKSILYMGDQIVAVGGDVIVFHPNEGINVEYLLYQLYCQAALKHRYINGKGDIIVHIYPTALGNTIITLPREADQNKVVSRINEIIDQVKKAIAVLTDEISVLREYRVRIVADTVTGKIDVRGIDVPEYEYVEETIDDNNEDCEEETEEQED